MSNYILGLDVGSVDVCAVIADIENGFSVCGIGKSKTSGIKKGAVTNIEQAANSIKQAVLDATKSAGVRYDRVVVSASAAYAKNVKSQGIISVPGKEIKIEEIKRAMQMAEYNASIPNDYIKLHILPYDFKVDDQEHIEDPLGMSGSRLEVSTHIVVASESSIKNLIKAVEMAGVSIDNLVLSAYASAISTLTQDEKELGVALIDMGGSTSDLIVHLGNSIVFNDTLLIGSSNITNDLSKAIHTPLPYAENVKLSYLKLIDKGHTEIELPTLGEDGSTHDVSLDIITNVIYARVEETLMLLAKKLEDSGYKDRLGAGLVLTGGMAKLEEIKDLAMAIFDNVSIRIAQPKAKEITGLYEIAEDCANSCAIGLCLYGAGKFTPYEIDSNGELRYKDEIIKPNRNLSSSNFYEEELNKANISKNTKNSTPNFEVIDELDEIPAVNEIHKNTFKSDEPNVVQKLWNKLTQLF